MIRNAGTAPLHFTRIEFLTAATETLEYDRLSPNYVMLLENRYARAYDIKIPRGHVRATAHPPRPGRCQSVRRGAGTHPADGTHQPSTLKTGEVVWRLAATHVGHNLGKTDLWVIAVEPK